MHAARYLRGIHLKWKSETCGGVGWAGHNGCMQCLSAVQQLNATCPLCRTPFPRDMQLMPNRELQELVALAKALHSVSANDNGWQTVTVDRPRLQVRTRTSPTPPFTCVQYNGPTFVLYMCARQRRHSWQTVLRNLPCFQVHATAPCCLSPPVASRPCRAGSLHSLHLYQNPSASVSRRRFPLLSPHLGSKPRCVECSSPAPFLSCPSTSQSPWCAPIPPPFFTPP